MNPKEKFFRLAKRVSQRSDHHSHKIGCVIVYKNRVISIGFNRLCTHPKSIHKHKSLHAEISALIGIPLEELKNCVAYVYRETKDGNAALSKPCEACEQALRMSGIKRVYYTVERGWACQDYKAA